MMQTPSDVPSDEPVETTLQRYVDDYARDPMIQDVVFGIEVEEEAFTVTAERPAADGEASATLTRGLPEGPAFVYTANRETFDRIRTGIWTANTAMAAAFSTDVTPLTGRFINGMEPSTEWSQTVFRPLNFHFWTMGQPEIVKLGFDHARTVHGGEGAIGIYAPGIRSSWYGVLPGQHINEDPRSRTDPWTSAFFVIRGGTAKARIGDKEIDMEDMTMILVPPNTNHEFWNPGDEPADMIMVTFGQDS